MPDGGSGTVVDVNSWSKLRLRRKFDFEAINRQDGNESVTRWHRHNICMYFVYA